MLTADRSQPVLLKCGKDKDFSIFQQYYLRHNSFKNIFKVLGKKCSYKKTLICLFIKKLDTYVPFLSDTRQEVYGNQR